MVLYNICLDTAINRAFILITNVKNTNKSIKKNYIYRRRIKKNLIYFKTMLFSYTKDYRF